MMRSLNFKKYNIGWFTLIEILLVIVAIAIMMVVGLTAVRWLLSTVKFKSSREIFVTDYNYILVKSFSTSLTGAKIFIQSPDQSHQSILRFELTPDPTNIKQLFSFAPTPGLIVPDWWVLRFKENLWCERSSDWGVTRNSTPNPVFKISYLSQTSNLTKSYKINLTTCKIWITQASSS
jgi:hypothetical protein